LGPQIVGTLGRFEQNRFEIGSKVFTLMRPGIEIAILAFRGTIREVDEKGNAIFCERRRWRWCGFGLRRSRLRGRITRRALK
jgi:hypothetical protein